MPLMPLPVSPPSAAASPSSSGRWWLGVMGLFLILAGTFFAWRMWLSYEKAQVARRWTKVPCRIVSSRVVSERPTPNSPPAHRMEVRYEYEFNGAPYSSHSVRQVEAAPSQHLEDVRLKQQGYPPGAEKVCYVNPQAPDEAVLEHASRAALYSIWFPLLFVVGGVGMIRGAVRKSPGIEAGR